MPSPPVSTSLTYAARRGPGGMRAEAMVACGGWSDDHVVANGAVTVGTRRAGVRDGRNALVGWAVLSKGDFVTEPRDLTDLVPAEVRTELAAAVAAFELHGPAVTKA